MKAEDDLFNYPNLKAVKPRLNPNKPAVPEGYSNYERLKRAIQRTEPEAKETALALGNPDLLQHLHRPSKQFTIICELRPGTKLAETRENSFIDKINDIYWKIAGWWNVYVGGLIDAKHLARIVEQYPPFISLCQQAFMTCIYK